MRTINMNHVQQNYIVAKAGWQAAQKIQEAKYDCFLRDNKITEEELDSNIDFWQNKYEVFASAEIAASGNAWDLLKAAEKELLDFGLSLYPAGIRANIKEGIKYYRQTFLDLFMKTDKNAFAFIKAGLNRKLQEVV